jgi:hypothetical protein
MAQRRRRIIFNNDGDDIGGYITTQTKENEALAGSPEGLLKLRTKALLGSQVDSIFYHSALGLKLHHADGPYGEIYGAPDVNGAFLRNRINLLLNYGKDALDVMIDFCRKNDLEIFYSNRMNDAHDSYFPGTLYYLRVRHPEYTLGYATGGKSPEETLKELLQTRKTLSGYNFGLKVIRDLTVEAMREVCQTYDIDGIELDYFRSPHVFPMPADAAETELLNDMMREMRKMTEEEGLRRGRPILIAGRCINDLEHSLWYGLDVKTWLAEGLVDLLMPIHVGVPRGKQQGSLKEFIDLAHRYDVPAYPCMRRVDQEEFGPHGITWEICRGEAMSRFVEGADGITTFNRFVPTHQRWRELGDPKVLRDLNKTYTCPHDLPVTVTDKRSDPMPLLVGDDVTATAADMRRTLKLRVHVTGLTANHGLEIELNGQTLEPTMTSPELDLSPQEVWFEFSPEPTIFQAGENLVTAKLKHAGGTVTIDDLGLDVVYVD